MPHTQGPGDKEEEVQISGEILPTSMVPTFDTHVTTLIRWPLQTLVWHWQRLITDVGGTGTFQHVALASEDRLVYPWYTHTSFDEGYPASKCLLGLLTTKCLACVC